MAGSIHFDFSKAATRKTILGTLVAALDKKQKPITAGIINDLTIHEKHHYHNIAEVEEVISRAAASEGAKTYAKGVYRILAEAEAQVHGCSVEDTHFHEVGIGMTIREILCSCAAFDMLKPSNVTATPVQTGSGKVECAHGVLDIPAPATAAILERYNIPVQEQKLEGELCTPTSAALIAYFVKEFV